jgi:hypothetical protein
MLFINIKFIKINRNKYNVIIFISIYILLYKLMGANVSSYTEIVNQNQFNIDQSVRNRIDSDCISNTKQNNLLQIVGSKVENLKAEQLNEVKSLCILQTVLEYEKDAKVTNDILSTISKQLEAKGGLPGTAGNAESTTKVYNQMNMNLDQSQVNDLTKNCIMNIKQDNVIQIFGSNVKNADLTQVNKGFIECLQNHSETTGMSAEVANKAKAELDESVKASGLDSYASLAQMTGIFVGGAVLICLGSSAVSAISSMGGGGGGGAAPPPPPDMGSLNTSS